MGFQDRDYERSYDTGSGWRDSDARGGGFATWSANSKLLALLVAVFVAQNVIKGFTEVFVLPADWYREPWRVYGMVAYSLLHSTANLQHLLFNGVALFFFGRTIDQRLGGREYLTFFFASSAFAGLAWSLTELATPHPAGQTPELLGASGGIAAILVLFALCYPNAKIYIWGVLPVSAWLLVSISVLGDALGFFGNRESRVAFAAHLGGALFGYLYYRYGWRLSTWLPDWLGGGAPAFGSSYREPSGGFASLFRSGPKLRVHTEEDEEEAEESSDDRLDEILRKIQASGRDSLSRSEQRYLEQASKRYKDRRRG